MALPTQTPRRVFVDSSALFAAAYSRKGSARDLLIAAIDDRVTLVLSDYVLVETERNPRENAPHALLAFHRLRDALPYRLRNPSKRLILDTARVIVVKDAPVVAAARSARVKLVATYDRKDLISKREAILDAFGITVATPEEILNLLGLR
jgi:predicted nucleic acid-binding protein